MTQVARMARFRIDPSRREELFAAYAVYAAAVQMEPGTEVWEMCTDAQGDDIVWLFVRATDGAAMEAHRTSDALGPLGSVLMPSLVGDPEFHDLVPRFSNRPAAAG